MYRKVAVVSIVVLVLSLAFASVSFAQTGSTSSNLKAQVNSQGLGPDNAYRALGPGGMRNLRANEQQWYEFEYAGDNSPIQIRLTGSNMQFSVWTQQDISNAGGNFGASANPVGRSTSNDQFGGDQFWQGQFSIPGTYYIMVENANGGQGGNYTLTVTGSGVTWKGANAKASSTASTSAAKRTTSASAAKSTASTSAAKSTASTSAAKSTTSTSANNSTASTSTAKGTTPKTLPRTGGEMASVLPMLIGGMGALSVTAGALLRRRK